MKTMEIKRRLGKSQTPFFYRVVVVLKGFLLERKNAS